MVIVVFIFIVLFVFMGCVGGIGFGDGMEGMDYGGSLFVFVEVVDVNDVDIMFVSMMKEYYV